MPIDIGQTAPDFALKDQNNQEVRLSDFRGRRNVLLVFYPLAFTGTCQGELCQVRDNLHDFWPHGTVAQAYGVFDADRGFANRGTFLIDRDGVVRFAEMTGPGQPRDQDAWRKAMAALA